MNKIIIKIITILNIINLICVPHLYAKYVIEKTVIAAEIRIICEQEI